MGIGDNVFNEDEMHPLEHQLQVYIMSNNMSKHQLYSIYDQNSDNVIDHKQFKKITKQLLEINDSEIKHYLKYIDENNTNEILVSDVLRNISSERVEIIFKQVLKKIQKEELIMKMLKKEKDKKQILVIDIKTILNDIVSQSDLQTVMRSMNIPEND